MSTFLKQMCITAMVAVLPQILTAQIVVAGDSRIATESVAATLSSQTVVTMAVTATPDHFADSLSISFPYTNPAHSILVCPPASWFPRKADVNLTFSLFQSAIVQLHQTLPQARIFILAPLPSTDPNVNRNQQELFILLAKDWVAHCSWAEFTDIYTPLTEKLDIAVSPYPTSPKTKAEELAKKLRSPIPYRVANDEMLNSTSLTPQGIEKLVRLIRKKIEK